MIHPYTGAECVLDDGTKGRIVTVGQSHDRDGAVQVAIVLLPNGRHEEVELVDLELPSEDGMLALRAYWLTFCDIARHNATRPPLGWRVHGDRTEAIMAVPEGEPHPLHPEWRAACAADGQPDGWRRTDGLRMKWAAGAIEVTVPEGRQEPPKLALNVGPVHDVMAIVNSMYPMQSA